MAINRPLADKMIRPADAKNKMNKVKVKILRPFMYNGAMLAEGAEVEMSEDRAANHMRVGDVERDEALISAVKERRAKAAQAMLGDAQSNW